ncbi:desulfoferrodoxin FeS4 iron-binding domain-containing protein [archaeon]|nr:desulfoferrodoxin FeS4 iron-binding domain-containing protein [archaeon]TET28696.1 MAG: desulfoferrodoxin FeS4 iron-binding domain-containing protein [Candidatus Bathyarchaeum sp.]
MCGDIVEVVESGAGTLVCCGQPMSSWKTKCVCNYFGYFWRLA